MASVIDILIRAIWQGGSATDSAKRDLQELGRVGTTGAQGLEETAAASQRAGTSLGSMALKIGVVTAALGTGAVAAKRFFDAIERGAGLELTARRFDRLAESIGTTGDALRTDLLEATSGMLSNAQAMALATDLIGLGLANTSDNAVRLARIVTELDADIGELTLALANQTTRRFDQLGISVAGFDDRLQALKGTMSDEEAFTMAFLAQAEAQIERVGGAADTTAGDIRRVQADIASLREELERELAFEAAPFLSDVSGRTAETLREQATAAATAADSVSDLQRAFNELNRAAEELQERDPGAFAFFVSEGFNQANVELLRALATMTDSAQEFEREAVRIFGPEGFVAAMVEAGLGGAEAFYEMANAIHAAADADRVLLQAHQLLVEETEAATTATEDFFNLLNQIPDSARDAAGEISRYTDALQRMADAEQDVLQRSRGGVAGAAAQAAQTGGAPFAELVQQEELQQDRADLFDIFQQSITDISDREGERRAQIEAQHEARRTDIVDDFNQRRAEEEQEWLRRRQRQAEELERNIADVRDDSAERQAELREDANRRLEDLEEDHLERMEDIIRDADAAINEAAGRLDIDAVQRLQQQKERDLEEEQENYEESRRDIEEELARRLAAEQAAAEERIREMQEFHDRRQAEEAADRDRRLASDLAAHEEQLAKLDAHHTARLNQLDAAAQAEIDELTGKYVAERGLLDLHWTEREALEQQKRDELLAAEEDWWNQRMGLISGASGGSAGGAAGSDPGAVGGGFQDPGVPAGGFAPSVTNTDNRRVTVTVEQHIYGTDGQSPEEIGGAAGESVEQVLLQVLEAR